MTTSSESASTAVSATLTDFLQARIVEDERKWRATSVANYTTHDVDCDFPGDIPGACTCHLVERLLAECEAKRRIVTRMSDADWDDAEEAVIGGILAAVYADHPDYREEWRP